MIDAKPLRHSARQRASSVNRHTGRTRIKNDKTRKEKRQVSETDRYFIKNKESHLRAFPLSAFSQPAWVSEEMLGCIRFACRLKVHWTHTAAC